MPIEREILHYVLELMTRLVLFSLAVAISPVVGRWLLGLISRGVKLLGNYQITDDKSVYESYIQPFQNSLTLTGAFAFIAICLNVLIQYEDLYNFLGVFVYSALSVCIIWFASKLARQIIHRSVIGLVNRWFGEVSEVVLIFETLIYVLIIILAIIVFAIGLRVNLIALGASVGISGVAIAFAAQQTLGRLFGTLELYLDRPYVSGEYIRVNFNPYGEDVYGLVEAIGLRSTKIRIVAQNTMMIVPNSTMAGKNIENVSRGKKTMAMLCLDFSRQLRVDEQALVTRTIEQESRFFWGFDKTSTRVQYGTTDEPKYPATRARVFFFITSPTENSLELRKRLLDLANSAIAQRLAAQNLRFVVPEPTVYIDSPMTL
ncbi:putative small conductance mechanosensitive ion channel protein [Halomicronema hongdechloris C2206]|uniref:Small conductance mechanosensitive ion channel protein n=1 Tax=Halomicronema hongdechloris C2206 TaxID=1641165 RepID=A0A1Z3HMT5_9CYAN|nr:mechanosensitive ion channel domain-containing protein [Halomicronema hongdechloris]ASC71601.1 putative small conductance mechanosensitive ion channel protein [Halomicronema hongdechloris C2206]